MTTSKETSHDDLTPMDESVAETARSVYADYEIWTKRKSKPKWHPVKKMRYVFFRMIAGCTITEALKEIRWSPSEFWHLIDLKRNDPFAMEYRRAKTLQGRAIADHVVQISEGRDRSTKRSMRRMKQLIEKSLNRAAKQKSPLAARAVIESLLKQIDANDSSIIQRNKVQIDAAKWLARAVNPTEFSEKSSMSLTGVPDGSSGEARPIVIQFVGPDGSVVSP